MLKHILDNFNHATATCATSATSEVENDDQVARIARVQVATPEKTDIDASGEVISNWWLIHFIDIEPVQVAIWRPCNHSYVLAMNPKAIAAEPVKSPINEISSLS
jgi:hypothetical protein